MRVLAAFLFALLLVLTQTGPIAAAGHVRVAIHDGLVTIDAVDATLADILNEWARVGGSAIVNGDLARGPAVTVELSDLPERDALATLLRSSVSYLAVSRAEPSTGASRYTRIVLMPARAAAPQIAPAPVVAAARPLPAVSPALPPEFSTPGVTRILGPGGQPVADDQDNAPPFVPTRRPPPPGFTFGDEPPHPATAAPAKPSGNTPVGASAPGVIMPPPATPNSPQPPIPPQR